MPTTAARAAKMPKKEMEKFRRLLEAKKNSLSTDLAKTRNAEEETTEESTQDIADKAASSYNKEFLFHQSNADRQLLQMVENALARIREGNFGECISCGKEINSKRLDAVPWTRHCIECQEKLENGLLEEASR